MGDYSGVGGYLEITPDVSISWIRPPFRTNPSNPWGIIEMHSEYRLPGRQCRFLILPHFGEGNTYLSAGTHAYMCADVFHAQVCVCCNRDVLAV